MTEDFEFSIKFSTRYGALVTTEDRRNIQKFLCLSDIRLSKLLGKCKSYLSYYNTPGLIQPTSVVKFLLNELVSAKRENCTTEEEEELKRAAKKDKKRNCCCNKKKSSKKEDNEMDMSVYYNKNKKILAANAAKKTEAKKPASNKKATVKNEAKKVENKSNKKVHKEATQLVLPFDEFKNDPAFKDLLPTKDKVVVKAESKKEVTKKKPETKNKKSISKKSTSGSSKKSISKKSSKK